MAEIDEGAYLPGYASAEEQVVIQGEIDDWSSFEIASKEANGTQFTAEQHLLFPSEM